MDIRSLIDQHLGEVVEFRRHIHQNAELSGREYGTMAAIGEVLSRFGIEHKVGVAETGVVAVINPNGKGKCVGIRADTDALPVMEETGLPFQSTNGAMHACGHDAHVAILLGAGIALKAMESELPGPVKLFFQPAEEAVGGAERMIEAGCLENPHVDAVFGLHVMNDVKTGQVRVLTGPAHASADSVDITVLGKSCHGAHPDEGVDPVVAAADIVLAAQTLITRRFSAHEPLVFTVGSVHGGARRNIIPDEVKLECTLRTLDSGVKDAFMEKLTILADGIAQAHGARVKVETTAERYPELVNDGEMAALVRRAAAGVLGAENVLTGGEPSMGAEDFSFFALARPACYFFLGCALGDGRDFPAHGSRFQVNEDCIPLGIELHVQGVLAYFEKYK